jgi:glucan phosphoethanolaminetransferase (alkaline phosphatase superfamily)
MEPMTPAEIQETLQQFRWVAIALCVAEGLILLLFLNIIHRGGWFDFLSGFLLVLFVALLLLICFYLAVLLFHRSATFKKSISKKNVWIVSWGQPLSPEMEERLGEIKSQHDPVKDDRDDDI